MTITLPPLRRILFAVLIGLAAYFSFWALATLFELKARPDGFGTHREISFTPLTTKGDKIENLGTQTAKYQKPYRFISRLPDLNAQIGRFQVTFEHNTKLPKDSTKAAADGLGLMLNRRIDVLEIRLNGHKLHSDRRSPRLSGSFVSEPGLFYLPAPQLISGTNSVEFDIRRSLRDPFLFPDFTIAPVESLRPVYDFRNLMIVDASIVGLSLMLLIALLCVLINWPSSEQLKMRSFVTALLSSLGLGSLFLFANVEHIPFSIYVLLHSAFSLSLGVSSMLYAFTDRVQGTRNIRRRMTLSCAATLSLAVILTLIYYTGLPGRFWLHGSSVICMLFAAFSLVVAAVQLIWNTTAYGRTNLAERFILIIWFGAVAFDRGEAGIFTMSSPFVPGLPLSLHWLPILGSIVGLAVLTLLAKQASEAREIVVSANELLATKLAEREAELECTYLEREQLLARQAVEDERHRIMRDMHDGLGSNLMSMLLAARRGKVEPDKIAEGLQSVVDEMRLMIDSMDSVGETLSTALATFRERLRSRVEGAGFTLHWRNNTDAALPDLGPQKALQIFRIMQEAVTNALKHSHGTAITITIADTGDPQLPVRIAIADNGTGPAPPKQDRPGHVTSTATSGGRGLGNMRIRAAAIGAKLQIDSGEPGSGTPGTCVTLTLPARLAAEATA